MDCLVRFWRRFVEVCCTSDGIDIENPSESSENASLTGKISDVDSQGLTLIATPFSQ